ncbi:MAG TPA: PLP-dependent aminotransferase family protein [Ktedonobacteraceae bacterium]|nr:PLP-dependent aminotransferase family protein [Ktedonobacteraceae bacterium]
MPTVWDQRYAQRVQRIQGSAIRELLKVTEMPGAISLAGGLPAGEIFPLEQISEVTQRILATQGQQALQYGPTEGYTPLRELLAERLSAEGVRVSRDNIVIISGSQQGLDLLGKLFVNPGDPLLVESPTYMGALQAFNPYEPQYIAVRSDEQGIVTAELESALQRHPTCMYVLPSFQNPSGITFTLERRQQLIELAGRYNVPILEDDPYSQLRFEGESLPSLLALEHARQQQAGQEDPFYQGNVILLNTFSKVLTPGLRVAWIVAPAEVCRKLTLAKQGTDLHTATFNQMIAYELMREGFLEKHVPVIRALYRERRDAMLAALAEYFPDTVHWTHPEGGLFLWVTVPEGIDTAQLLGDALEYRIAFVPGAAFHANGGGANTMRLSFSNVNQEQIEEGIRRLGKLLHKHMLKA